MSNARNRSQSRDTFRALTLDLQGELDTLIAFDGFEPEPPLIQPFVLQRPSERKGLSRLERLLIQLRRWLEAVRRMAMG